MMKISTKTEYALRCLIFLGRQEEEDKAFSISELAKRQCLPKAYIEQILLKLKRTGLVASVRGTRGGFHLSRRPEEISVGEVIRVLEGIPFHNTCDHFNQGDMNCGHLDGCSLRPVWSLLEKVLWEFLDRTTLKHLLGDEKDTEGSLKLQLPVLNNTADGTCSHTQSC